MTRRELMIDYAMRFVGKPYIWSGNGIVGFDCSGLAQECLASVGLDPKGDQTAQMLRVEFVKEATGHPDIGCLVFFGRPEKAVHVAVYIGDGLMIEAGGGGSSCKNPEESEKLGAMVRIRPVKNRVDLLGYADPFLRLA